MNYITYYFYLFLIVVLSLGVVIVVVVVHFYDVVAPATTADLLVLSSLWFYFWYR